jgi:hypothetical protein
MDEVKQKRAQNLRAMRALVKRNSDDARVKVLRC